MVKYFALPAVGRMARQLAVARERNPQGGLDLSALNLADARPLFRRADAS
jgi:hypothetical protein